MGTSKNSFSMTRSRFPGGTSGFAALTFGQPRRGEDGTTRHRNQLAVTCATLTLHGLGHFLPLLLLLCFGVGFASPSTDKALQEQRNALKQLEKTLSRQRNQLKLLETEEKGVLNTISLLDQNLNQTREYVNVLSANEMAVNQALMVLGTELDSLDHSISLQQNAMQKRVRELYIKGHTSNWEYLYRLLRQKENPERHLYMVRRLLTEDKSRVDKLQASLRERELIKKKESAHLVELRSLKSKKAIEEKGLVGQIHTQSAVLDALKKDKNMQRRALKEFERDQKTMLALINKLEEKRKRELEEARKKKNTSKGSLKAPPSTAVAAVGPKCMPLQGDIISQYGSHEHPVLHIMTKNLGIEIRGKRGSAVKAAARGKVVMVTEIDGRGPSVIIEHEGGVYSVYGHLNSIRVREGMDVHNCEEIGELLNISS
jgi:septal ring factor EnvC (AmiA/AmiB activator)